MLRHKERHTTSTDQSHKKTSIFKNPTPLVTSGTSSMSRTQLLPETTGNNGGQIGVSVPQSHYSYQADEDSNTSTFSPTSVYSNPTLSDMNHHRQPSFSNVSNTSQSITDKLDIFPRSNFSNQGQLSSTTPSGRPHLREVFGSVSPGSFSHNAIQASVGDYGVQGLQSVAQSLSLSTPPNTENYYSHLRSRSTPSQDPHNSVTYVDQGDFAPLILSSTSFMSGSTSKVTDPAYAISPAVQGGFSTFQSDAGSLPQSEAQMAMYDEILDPRSISVFGGSDHSRSPYHQPDDFVAFLLGQQPFASEQHAQASQETYNRYAHIASYNVVRPFFRAFWVVRYFGGEVMRDIQQPFP
jgi:hypothetical protein